MQCNANKFIFVKSLKISILIFHFRTASGNNTADQNIYKTRASMKEILIYYYLVDHRLMFKAYGIFQAPGPLTNSNIIFFLVDKTEINSENCLVLNSS